MSTTEHDPTPRRIAVSGTTGSGKTTLAASLAALTGAPHVELDALYWEPDWTEAPPEIFRARVAAALAGDRWVSDGNYSVVRDITWARAELLLWLDYSIARIFWQLMHRTTRRVVTQQELWAGNRERFRTAFMSKESLFVWALQTHWKKRREYPAQLREHPHLRVVRLRSPRATAAFVRTFEQLAASRGDPRVSSPTSNI